MRSGVALISKLKDQKPCQGSIIAFPFPVHVLLLNMVVTSKALRLALSGESCSPNVVVVTWHDGFISFAKFTTL